MSKKRKKSNPWLTVISVIISILAAVMTFALCMDFFYVLRNSFGTVIEHGTPPANWTSWGFEAMLTAIPVGLWVLILLYNSYTLQKKALYYNYGGQLFWTSGILSFIIAIVFFVGKSLYALWLLLMPLGILIIGLYIRNKGVKIDKKLWHEKYLKAKEVADSKLKDFYAELKQRYPNLGFPSQDICFNTGFIGDSDIFPRSEYYLFGREFHALIIWDEQKLFMFKTFPKQDDSDAINALISEDGYQDTNQCQSYSLWAEKKHPELNVIDSTEWSIYRILQEPLPFSALTSYKIIDEEIETSRITTYHSTSNPEEEIDGAIIGGLVDGIPGAIVGASASTRETYPVVKSTIGHRYLIDLRFNHRLGSSILLRFGSNKKQMYRVAQALDYIIKNR